MIYFDNSATTKPYEEVLDSFVKVSSDFYGNPSSLHGFGAKADQLLQHARKQTAEIMGVHPSEIYFTSGGTEGNNLAIKGAVIQHASRGRHIITSQIEHPSVIEACEELEKQGFSVDYLPVKSDGSIDIEDVKKAVRNDTILVSIMHVNNEVGSIQPIEEIGQWLSKNSQALFHVDYVQGCGKIPLSLQDGFIDLCTISGHKIHGLKGTGVLYINSGVKITPLFSGGKQESKMRSGTENTAGMVAFAKALRMTEEKRKTSISHLWDLRNYLYNEILQIKGTVMNTPQNGAAPHIINFSIPGIKGEVLVHALEQEDIYVSTTSACSSRQKKTSRTLTSMGIPMEQADGSIRVSLSYGNTISEAERFANELKKIAEQLSKVIRRSK
ncbi:cysteine desulfurase family protein [Falsibacillus pallidus]|uniref:Cysteine desulfurase n=1 Tax=Falsibacillus pallidus TaxID=493781 RepID=A0A370GKV0_9BACI|nr:cysteine desulfurase family protein [Falsibacillus pallidus]RDI44287.1 cysteine desulfurase [Falsibacillus pallidus]